MQPPSHSKTSAEPFSNAVPWNIRRLKKRPPVPLSFSASVATALGQNWRMVQTPLARPRSPRPPNKPLPTLPTLTLNGWISYTAMDSPPSLSRRPPTSVSLRPLWAAPRRQAAQPPTWLRPILQNNLPKATLAPNHAASLLWQADATHPSLQLVDQRAQPHRTLHLEAGGPRPRLTPGCGHCNPKPLCLSATPAWIVDPMRFRLTWRGPSEQAAVSRRCHKLHRKIKTLGKITNALTDTSCQTLIVWRCPACGNLVFSRSSRLRALFVSFSLFFVLLFFSSLSLSLHASLLHKGSGSRVNVCPRPCLSTLSMGQARNPLTSLTTLCA